MLKSLKTLPHIAAQHYKITVKGAGLKNLAFTLIQLRILFLLQRLLEVRKRANIVIVKPRQIMSTTLFNSAEFHMSYNIEGLKTLILTHRAKVSTEVFENLKRFQEKMPSEMKMETTQNNDYKISWKNDSEVSVGTAGTDSGRGFPCLILHLSELGRYRNRHVMDVQEGAMQAHASAEEGAIVAAESTSGGEGNYFHDIAKLGYKNPKSSWFTAFFGWNEMPEYRLPPPPKWEPDSEEVRLMRENGLDMQQIYWRHVKLHEQMRGNLTAFQREYPLTFEEAFSSAENRLIDAVVMLNAMNSTSVPDPSLPLILGVDPAGKGDRTALVYRQGFVITDYEVFNRMDDVTLANIVLDRVHRLGVDHVFIDMGYGHGTYHLIRSLGFFQITGVHFGSAADNKMLYFNKRAEMAAHFQDWCEEGPSGMGGVAKIPDKEEYIRDIKMIPDLEYSGDGQKFKLATKEEIKAELGKSPDLFDGTILTFAHPVRSKRLILPASYTAQQTGQSMLVTENVFQELSGIQQQQSNPNYKYYNYGN